jgi:transglutaminase-like putative cysteine protease
MNHNRIGILGAATWALILVPVLSTWGQEKPDVFQYMQQAQDLAKTEKYDLAIDLMKKAIEAEPKNDLALAMISDYEFKARKYADGLEHAQRAIKINDKIGSYYTLAASNSWGNQDLDRAREYCEMVLKGGVEAFGPGAVNDARIIQDLLVPKKYTLTWTLDPRKAHMVSGAIAIAMPKADLPYQTSTFEIDGVKSHRFVKGAANDVLNVVPQGTKTITLVMKVTVQPYSFKKELAREVVPKALPLDVVAFLGPSELINPKSPVLIKVVAGLKGANNVDTARNILLWMKKNIAYKLNRKAPVELDFKMVDDLIERGHAECRGQAMLFTALCRAAGIPARSVWGMARPPQGQDKQFGAIASHNWSEFYVPGTGWVPVDPQAPETLGFLPTRCIRIFMDVKKSKSSLELVPMLNLTAMCNAEGLKVEEAR